MTPPESLQVSVGEWSFTLDGLELRHIAHRGVEVLRRAHLVVRDTAWATIPFVVTEHEIGGDGRSADWWLRWSGRCESSDVSMTFETVVRFAGPVLTCRARGRADGPAEFNRIGWCFQHPLSFAGSRVRLRNREHSWVTSSLSRLVAPQRLTSSGPRPALGPFSQLTLERPAHIEMSFEGDLFELEDQRNWTDATFKTYSTPLSDPRPLRLAATEELHQDVSVRVEPAHPVPIGALVSQPPSTAELTHLRELCDFVRVEIRCDTAEDRRRTRALFGALNRAGLPVHLVVLAADDTEWEWLRQACGALQNTTRVPITQVLVMPRDGEIDTDTERTSPKLLEQARRGLHPTIPDASIGGGTLHSFCELQRHPLEHLPHVCFSINPTLHSRDESTIRESVESVGAIAETLQTLVAPGSGVHVGPILAAVRPLDTVGVPASALPEPTPLAPTDRRRPTRLPPDYVEAVIAAWAHDGVDSLCTLEASALVDSSGPTEMGRAVGRARQELTRSLAPSEPARRGSNRTGAIT